MTIPNPIASAADYADALLTARRFKNFLFWLLLLILLAQLTIFLLAKYTTLVLPPESASTTQPATRPLVSLALQYLVGLTDFLGLLASVLFPLVLLLMLLILIQGRLLGVAQLTTAFLTSLFLAVLLFPWQAYLNYPDLGAATFRLPGVLYTWSELVAEAQSFDRLPLPAIILKWARYLAFPLLALFLLLRAQSKSRRALRLALGEVDYTTPPVTSPSTPPPPPPTA